MDSSLNNSNSEINSQNKYKFDNYGIVMADSIEDLLYDKYNERKKRKNKKKKNNDSNSDSDEKSENNDENDENYDTTEKKNNPINDDSTSFTKESKFYDISISRNVNLQFIQKTKKNTKKILKMKDKHSKHNNSKDENYSKKKKSKVYDSKEESIEKDDDDDYYNNGKTRGDDSKRKNKKDKSYRNKDNYGNHKKNKKKYYKAKYLKVVKIQGIEIESDKIRQEREKERKRQLEKEKRGKIKIIVNINNKPKREVELDPESSSIKNIFINADKKTVHTNKSNSSISEKEKQELFSNDISNDDDNSYYNKKNMPYIEDNINCKSINKIKMFFKKIEPEIKNDLNDINNNNKINNDNYKTHKNCNSKINTKIYSKSNSKINQSNNNLKKIHLVASERNIMSNINKKIKKPHNMPISSQCYIYKTRKEQKQNAYLNKIVPKKERMFITKAYIQKKKNYNIKIVTLPNSTMCYFYKDQKIINVRSHIPLQNVTNNNYFCTKEKCSAEEEIMKRKLLKKCKRNNTEISYEIQGKLDNVQTEINADSPNIIIKIKNPLNSSYKYGKINIKTNSPSFIKSKSCQKIRSDNKNDTNKKSYLINIIKEKNKNKLPMKIDSKKTIKKIKKTNNRYNKNNMDAKTFKCLKNKEIINALNNSVKYKWNCPACITLNKRKEYAEKLQRNMGMKNKNKNNEKAESNVKIKSLKPDIHNLKKKILFSPQEEEKIAKNKLRNNIIDSNLNNIILPKTRISNDYNFNNMFNNIKPNYNVSGISFNKNSSNTHIQFPAIDSYFH